MAHVLHPRDYIHLLHCPCSESASLVVEGDAAVCSLCHRRSPIRDDCVLELVNVDMLDAETARELKGNTYHATPAQITAYMAVEQNSGWAGYYAHSRKQSIQVLARYLKKEKANSLYSLGSGTGREIFYLQQFMDFDTVYCSDLSSTALQMVPYRLAPFDIKIGLFTADLAQVPIKSKDIPVLIVNALHHTQDMHAALKKSLEHGHHNIFLIEPTNNFLIRLLARWKLSQRIEYSGVKPGRLEIGELRRYCQEHQYLLSLTTLWTFPPDYFQRIFGSSPLIRRFFIAGMTLVSSAMNWIHFGNITVAHLKKACPAGLTSSAEVLPVSQNK